MRSLRASYALVIDYQSSGFEQRISYVFCFVFVFGKALSSSCASGNEAPPHVCPCPCTFQWCQHALSTENALCVFVCHWNWSWAAGGGARSCWAVADNVTASQSSELKARCPPGHLRAAICSRDIWLCCVPVARPCPFQDPPTENTTSPKPHSGNDIQQHHRLSSNGWARLSAGECVTPAYM